eukprot:CAMPEP_0178378484 /NCGR_PEP_ID=MMETSP0689_2-20121128/4452_1 /TAXON_ID=160604 /ORGANISM="Amphidinium massartii, Strain CS-259" /LENGTH=310 /DNA_ID=CAMNT_0019998559 /DNA_START=35 /DNA_END=963 /DNA_ORIENTATION=-
MSSNTSSHRAVLGVGAGATKLEVRRAFLRIARECHPDKNSAAGAAERFRRARTAFEALAGQAESLSAAELEKQLDEIDLEDAAFLPQEPRKKRPRPPPPEPTEPEPVLCLADLLDFLREQVQHAAGELDETSALRRRFGQSGVLWPWGCSDALKLPEALAQALRDELDRRVACKDWLRLEKQDIVWWLDGHGCSMKYALDDDAVTKDRLVELVQKIGSAPAGGVPTPIPALELQPSSTAEADEGTPRPSDAAKEQQDDDDARVPNEKTTPSEKSAGVATAADYAKWLRHLKEKGRCQKGIDFLLKEATEG